MIKTVRLLVVILLATALSTLLVACRSYDFAERPAAEMNVRLDDLGDGWALDVEVDSSDEGDGGMAAGIVDLVQASGAQTWLVRLYTQEDATIAGMVMVFPNAQAAEEAMASTPVADIMGTPKVVAELYAQVEGVVTGDEGEPVPVVLEEQEQGVGDEALLTWVEGGDSYALVVRKLNVISAVVGITTKDGRDLAPAIADRIQ